MADPKDKLRAFYDAIKANPNVKGIPDDYAQFEAALRDPQKSRQFYESVKSNPTIKGIPTDFDQFSNGLGLSPGKAAPVGSGVPTGEQGKPSQQPSDQPQTGPTYSFTYQKEKPKKKELDISFTQEEMAGRGQTAKTTAPKPQVPTAAEALDQSLDQGKFLKETYATKEKVEALPEVQRIKREEDEYRAIKPVADEYRQNISGRAEGMDILGLQQAFKRAKGLDQVDTAAAIENELKDAYKAIDEDYLQYVISTRPQLGNDKIAMYENIRAKQEKGEKLSQPEERFMKDLRDEAMSAYYTAKKAELYELKTQASIGEYMRDTGLLSKRADILQQEYDGLAGKPLTAQSRKRIAEIQNELQGVQGKAEAIAEQTGVTPEVLDRYNKLQTDIAAVDNGFEDNSDRFDSLQEEEMDKRIRDQYRKDEGMAKAVMYSFSDAINQGLGSAAKFVKTEIAPPDGKVDFADELYNWADNWQKKSTSRVGRPFSAEEWDKMSMIDKAPYLFGEGLGSVTLFAAGGAAGRGTKLGTAISAYVMAEPGAYEEAISLGMDIDEARSVARPIAAAEAMIESMIPDIKYFNAPNFRKSILKQVKEGVPLKEAIATNTKQFLKEVGENSVKEFGEETAAAVAVDTTKEAINAAKGEDIYKDTFDPEAIAEQGVAGFLTGGGMSAIGSITRPRSPIAEDMVLQLAESPDQIVRVAEMVTPEQMEDITAIQAEAQEVFEAASKMPGFENLSREDKATVISELQRKKQIEAGVKGTGVDIEGAQAQIAEIDARVGEILSKPQVVETGEAVAETPQQEVIETTETVIETEPKPDESAQGSDSTPDGGVQLGDSQGQEVGAGDVVQPAAELAEGQGEVEVARGRAAEIMNDIYFNTPGGRNNDILDEGFANAPRALNSTLDIGGDQYAAHGMGKSTVASAIKDLFALFDKGIDPNRGGGRLYVDSFAAREKGKGAGTGTATGTAYMDGPFTLVARRGEGRDGITDMSQVGGIIVNDGIVDARPEILDVLRAALPGIVIESTSNARSLIEQMNQQAEATQQASEQAETSKKDEKIDTSEASVESVNISEPLTAIDPILEMKSGPEAVAARREYKEKYGKDTYEKAVKITRNFDKIVERLENEGKVKKKCP